MAAGLVAVLSYTCRVTGDHFLVLNLKNPLCKENDFQISLPDLVCYKGSVTCYLIDVT